jgi:predicted transcriptional regulator of viral defense system
LASHLVVTLYGHNRPIFHFQEAAKILGGNPRASKVLSQLIHNGIVTRLKLKTFRLIPFELGFEREYLGNPYAVARELVLGGPKGIKEKYYLSYGSAFDLHQMTTQPQLIVYVSSPIVFKIKIWKIKQV